MQKYILSNSIRWTHISTVSSQSRLIVQTKFNFSSNKWRKRFSSRETKSRWPYSRIETIMKVFKNWIAWWNHSMFLICHMMTVNLKTMPTMQRAGLILLLLSHSKLSRAIIQYSKILKMKITSFKALSHIKVNLKLSKTRSMMRYRTCRVGFTGKTVNSTRSWEGRKWARLWTASQIWGTNRATILTWHSKSKRSVKLSSKRLSATSS